MLDRYRNHRYRSWGSEGDYNHGGYSKQQAVRELLSEVILDIPADEEDRLLTTLLETANPKHFNDVNKISLMDRNYKKYRHLKVKKRSHFDYVRLWVKYKSFDKNVDIPNLSEEAINYIAEQAPDYIMMYNLPVKKLYGATVKIMLENNLKKYLPVAIKRLVSIRNKTEARCFLKECQVLIPLLTEEDVKLMSLTAKDLALLVNHKEINEDISYNTEVKDWLELELSMEVLSGVSSNSRYLAKARQKLK